MLPMSVFVILATHAGGINIFPLADFYDLPLLRCCNLPPACRCKP